MAEAETKALLMDFAKKTVGQFEKQENKKQNEIQSWCPSDSGSSSVSYYSDSDSSEVEWESYIEPNGELFYVESTTHTFSETKKFETYELTRRKSMRSSKLMRLIKRKNSTRGSIFRNKKFNNSKRFNFDKDNWKINVEEYAHPSCQGRNVYSLNIWVDPSKRHKFGRRASMCEAYLGIIPGLMPTDNSKIIVTGFTSQEESLKYPEIKIGDLIKSINSRDVTSKNIDSILASIVTPMNVTVNLQKIFTYQRTENFSTESYLKQSPFVRQLVDKDHAKSSMEFLMNINFGVVYSKISNFTEGSAENHGVLYTFPRSKHKNVSSLLLLTKGAFVTLSHMLQENIGFHPVSTSMAISKELIHVIYTQFQDELLLTVYPDKWCSETESIEITKDIVRTLTFMNESISKCFMNQDNHSSLDHLFSLIFKRIVSERTCNRNHDHSVEHLLSNEYLPSRICEFETFFQVAHYIRLPRDAEIQIDAALNEMEAMDYRDWNEDPMDCQRLYTILGSSLYHKHYLLGSHLPYDMCTQVNSYLRENGLFNLISNEPVKSLVIWKKVYPSSSIKSISEYRDQLLLDEQYFLLVVGYGHDILAVILESGGCTAKYAENIGPDIFYVEEAQETLLHIRKVGVTTLAEKWISANAKPEIASYEDYLVSKAPVSLTENLLNFIKSTDSQSTLTKANINLSAHKKSQEVFNYIKQRTLDEHPVKSGSVYSLQTSEESLSQEAGAISEISDEAAPILGRRVTREKSNLTSRQSEDSDSDLDVYKNESQTSAMDISDIRENLLNQAQYITPKRLTSGKERNYLFHYIHLDLFEGILLSSYIDKDSTNNIKFLTNFNQCANFIHKLLQNTLRFKKMLNEDIDKSVINKNLVAIKEHGVLFEWENVTFWVVGRLYILSQPKEFYVCYDESAPQNLIEIAFRLNAMSI